MKTLHVLLVHGTWSAGKWTRVGSGFRNRLEAALGEVGYRAEYEAIPWNGKNRWAARSFVAGEINRRLNNAATAGDPDAEHLVVAHSHGGNIATEAVRARMQTTNQPRIRGVVCLNTPFLTAEVRGSSGYLVVWSLILFLLAAALFATGLDMAPVALPHSLGELLRMADMHVARLPFVAVLLLLGLFILFLHGVSQRILRMKGTEPWGPRPDVLCLSSPDDEAISFLGLGEGIANLPQLLLNPIALGAVLAIVFALMFFGGDLSWCGLSLNCWGAMVAGISVLFSVWIVVAVAGGMLGAAAVSLLFGVSLSNAFNVLVSRILVSYVPLRPARASFRGINVLPSGSPLRFLHTRIFESPQTVREICYWLVRVAE